MYIFIYIFIYWVSDLKSHSLWTAIIPNYAVIKLPLKRNSKVTRILDWHHCAKKAYNSIFTFLSAVSGCLQATFRWAVLLGHLPAQLIMTSKLIVFNMCHSFFVTFFNKNFVWSPVCKKKKSYYKAEADKNIRLPRSHKSHLTNILTCILLTASTSQLFYCLRRHGN